MGSRQWMAAAFALGAAMAITLTIVVRICIEAAGKAEGSRGDGSADPNERGARTKTKSADPEGRLSSSHAEGGHQAEAGDPAMTPAEPTAALAEAAEEHKSESARDAEPAVAPAHDASTGTPVSQAIAAPASEAPAVPTSEASAAPEPEVGARDLAGAPTTPTTGDAPATDASTSLATRSAAALAEEPLSVDMDKLADDLFRANDPLAELKRLLGRIRTAEAHARDGAAPKPDAIARYLARGLDEAGLLSPDAGRPDVSIVRPSRSKTFYLRVNDGSISWDDMVRVLAIEGALNRALFAWEHLVRDDGHALPTAGDDAPTSAPEPTVEDCYRFNQRLASSITAQLGPGRIGHASMSDVVGEWGARQAISAGIETFRLPERLTAQFRLNLMGGDAAIVADYVPWEAFPASVWSEELGRVVPASHQMRELAASTYAMRTALLLAGHAFRCSRRLCHVHVAAVLDSPTRHACLLSGDVSRDALDEVDLTAGFDAERTCRELGFRMRLVDGALTEVPQGFSLDEERFCPRTRYESVDLSNRPLPRLESMLLGADRVSDLAINENAHRAQVAQTVARTLGRSTERNVREIIGLTQADPDPTVREAGRRTATHLIDGSLPDDDVIAFSDDFVYGDALSLACERTVELLKRRKVAEAIDVLTEALAPVDALDAYRDTDAVAWREFTSYVDRALYNRLLAKEGQAVRLVPDPYYNAQLLMATALLAAGRIGQALGFARRAQDLDPLNMAGTLRVVRCLELLDRRDEAADELRRHLSLAYDPEGVGVGYYRLAFMEWRLGNMDVADACYQKALASRSSCIHSAMLELQTMRAVTEFDGVDPADVDDVLERAEVPLAPTDRVLTVLVEAAQGATDAEVFPVARSFTTLLGALSGDDVMHGVTNSIELEPDR